MFCPKCRAKNEERSPHCAYCGFPLQTAPPGRENGGNGPVEAEEILLPDDQPKPFNWLIPAIVTALCCGCIPLSVLAIVFAAQVDEKYERGDHPGALDAASKARLFTILSAIFGLIAIFLYTAMRAKYD